uniref:Homeodomain transcription factor 2 n=1 Tax=Heterorhabditis bacteriophora TaxID=37862 RepID=A0A1I7WC79_HETBA
MNSPSESDDSSSVRIPVQINLRACGSTECRLQQSLSTPCPQDGPVKKDSEYRRFKPGQFNLRPIFILDCVLCLILMFNYCVLIEYGVLDHIILTSKRATDTPTTLRHAALALANLTLYTCSEGKKKIIQKKLLQPEVSQDES